MRYRLIVTDIDGTLLNDNLEVTHRTRQVLAELCRRGAAVVLSTARPPRAVRALYEDLGLTGPVIAYNGALVYNPRHGASIFHHPIPRATALQVLATIRAVDPGLNVGLELADEWHVDYIDEPTRAWLGARQFGDTPISGDVEEAIATSGRGISKVYFVAREPLRQTMMEALDGAGLTRELSVTSSGANMFEIMAAGVDKGAALRALAALLGVPREQILALGDGLNDIPLLQAAGLGIAMENAPELVKRAATAVTRPNTEDGWAEAIERYVLAG